LEGIIIVNNPKEEESLFIMPKKAEGVKKATGKKGGKPTNPLFEKRPKNFGIGGDLQPRRDLSRFVRWPRYIKLQRQKRVLMQRLKVPPTINQFSKTVDKTSATQLFKLLNKYRPETNIQKRKRLVEAAQAKKEKKDTAPSKAPTAVKYGINQVTTLVEQKQAKLVVIAHDVDPIELVVWLPTLCRKRDVPYCIVKGKSRLGSLVHKKTTSVVALTNVNKEDTKDLSSLSGLFIESYNKNADMRRTWGGGKLGVKSLAGIRKKEKAIAKEQALLKK